MGIVIAALAIGGRRDPPTLRAAATLLDGSWRFHIGDDRHWADANTDDDGWETIDMTASPGSHDGDVGLPDYVGGWMAHGHPGYHGYAWYRLIVRPDGTFHLDLDDSDVTTEDEAAEIAEVVFLLRDEIRTVLRNQHVRH